MRIVGGEFRGRPLATPRTHDIRPTTDRTREAVFNVLAHRFGDRLEGARVLDLFAGTGALGLEALSRGAVLLHVHRGIRRGQGADPHQCRSIRPDRSHEDFPARRDAARRCRQHPALRAALRRSALWQGSWRTGAALGKEGGWLVPGALCVVEETAAAPFGPVEGFELIDERGYGETVIRFLEAV